MEGPFFQRTPRPLPQTLPQPSTPLFNPNPPNPSPNPSPNPTTTLPPTPCTAAASMTRPYTSSELANASLARPEWTSPAGDFVFANSSAWPSAGAAASDIPIGNAVWRLYLVRWRCLSRVYGLGFGV